MKLDTYADIVKFVRDNEVFKQATKCEGDAQIRLLEFVLANDELGAIICEHFGGVDDYYFDLLEDCTK